MEERLDRSDRECLCPKVSGLPICICGAAQRARQTSRQQPTDCSSQRLEPAGKPITYLGFILLEMIAHKIARILSGDPNHRDHWEDIAGYAELVVREIDGEWRQW
jgi:hypothetical protein